MAKKFDITNTTLDELEEALPIDENGLDQDCIVQPEASYRVGKRLALETSRRDAAKRDLADTEAEADSEIRRTAEREDEKLRETDIKNMVRIDPEVKKATDKLAKLQDSVANLSALRDAFSDRSKMLGLLQGLFLSGYYAEKTVRTPEARAAKERLADEGRAAMNRARRQKR
jgi:hypothetical protein